MKLCNPCLWQPVVGHALDLQHGHHLISQFKKLSVWSYCTLDRSSGVLYGIITMVPCMVTLQWCPVWWHYNSAPYGDRFTFLERGWTVSPHSHFTKFANYIRKPNRRQKTSKKKIGGLSVDLFTSMPTGLHCMLFTSWFRVYCNVCDVPVACFQLTAGKSDDMPHNENLIAQQYHSLQSITWLSHREQWLEDQEEMHFSIFMFRDFSCWCYKAVFSFGLFSSFFLGGGGGAGVKLAGWHKYNATTK